MFIINDDNSIELTRGDTAYITVSVLDYTFEKDDVILFTVKKRATEENIVFQKKYTIDETKEKITIKISPEDTKKSEFGNYVYDIQLTRGLTKDVHTIIPINKFTIAKEVS